MSIYYDIGDKSGAVITEQLMQIVLVVPEVAGKWWCLSPCLYLSSGIGARLGVQLSPQVPLLRHNPSVVV